jgi:hypothetical protein
MPGEQWHGCDGAHAQEEDVDSSNSSLRDEDPFWLHQRVRKSLHEQWTGFMQRCYAITGWDKHTTNHFSGLGGKAASIIAKMLRYNGPDGLAVPHGAIGFGSLLTAVLTSMPAHVMLLQESHKTKSSFVSMLRKVVGPLLTGSHHDISCAMAATGVTRRQAEIVLNAAAGFANKGPSAELDDALKIETGGVSPPQKRNRSGMFPTRKKDAKLRAYMRRAQLSANLRGFAMAWKHAHDRLGKGNGHGGYYVHDLFHHVGLLVEHAESRGLDGLGCLSNSVLEHWHQENGKPAFQAVHIMSQSALACVARDHKCGLGQCGPGTPKFVQSNPGQMILLTQLTKSICARLCPGCLRLPNQCPGTTLCSRGQTPKGQKFTGWTRVTRPRSMMPNPGETRTVGNAGLYRNVPEETQNLLNHIRAQADRQHIDALPGSSEPAQRRLTSNTKALSCKGRYRLAPGCDQEPLTKRSADGSSHKDATPPHAPDSDSIPSQCSGSCLVCQGKHKKGRAQDLPCAVLGHCGRHHCSVHSLCWHRIVAMCSVFRKACVARLPSGTPQCRTESLAQQKHNGPITDWINCLSDDQQVTCRTHIIAAVSAMSPEGMHLVVDTGDPLNTGPVAAAVLEHQISSQRGNGKRFTNLRAGKLKALLHSVLRNVCDLPQTRLLCV